MTDKLPTVEAQAARQVIAAAMDLRCECAWNWDAIAAALRVDLEWIKAEVEAELAAMETEPAPVATTKH